MTPKAQQVRTYDISTDDPERQFAKKETTNHQRSLSSSSNIIANINPNSNSPASLLLNRVTSVISPSVIFLVATPIALRYPLIQLIMFLTILVGTSPLYFIMITFIGKSNKQQHGHCRQGQPQPHRRQPSIVGAIGDDLVGEKQQQSGKTR